MTYLTDKSLDLWKYELANVISSSLNIDTKKYQLALVVSFFRARRDLKADSGVLLLYNFSYWLTLWLITACILQGKSYPSHMLLNIQKTENGTEKGVM